MNKAKCCVCGAEGKFGEGWYEVDDGDLCPACVAEWKAEQEQEIRYQEADTGHLHCGIPR